MNSIFTKLIIEKVLDNYPQINKDYCINKKQRKYICTVCQDCCHKKAIVSPIDENIDKMLCDDCSVCVSKCPTGAILGSQTLMEKSFNILNSKNKKIAISCNMYEGYSDCTMYSISSFPWELISAVALNNDVYIYKGDCENCTNYCDYDYTFNKVQSFLGEELYTNSIYFTKEPLEFSRLEAINFFINKSKSTLTSFMRSMTTIEDFNQIWRKILVYTINDNVINWDTPLFNDNCNACSICTKLCPTNALEVIKDKSNDYYMVHFPKKCRGCSLCENVCPRGGINEITTKSTKNSKSIITKLDATHCTICNELTTNTNKICTSCSNK